MLLSSSRRATAGEQIWSACWQALTETACRGRMRYALLKPRAATALIALSTPYTNIGTVARRLQHLQTAAGNSKPVDALYDSLQPENISTRT